jgi:hypothetical protein
MINLSPGAGGEMHNILAYRCLLFSLAATARGWRRKSSVVSGFNIEFDGKYDNVQCVTMNDLIKECDIDKIDFLKVDIEGSEKELFETNTKLKDNIIRLLSDGKKICEITKILQCNRVIVSYHKNKCK